MKKLMLFLCVCFLVLGVTPAFAMTIDVWEVTSENISKINEWKAAQSGSVHVLEDFENIDAGWSTQKETGVGTFTAGGLRGLGGTSYYNIIDRSSIYPNFSIQDKDYAWYGRSNTTDSEDASQWLDSGDITLLTLTIEDDSLRNLFFYIQDPADSGAVTFFSVNNYPNYYIFSNEEDNASFFVGITLAENETFSSLSWFTTSQSDGFGLDDFSTIHNPEPATMILFGFGLIGLAGITRRII